MLGLLTAEQRGVLWTLVLLLLVTGSDAQYINFTGRDGGQYSWPRPEQRVLVKGDVYLGGLISVHDSTSYPTRHFCGEIMLGDGVQALEALLFTVDTVNKQKLAGPDIKLGVVVKDICHSESYAVTQAADLIEEIQQASSTSDLTRSNASSTGAAPMVGVITNSYTFSDVLRRLSTKLESMELPTIAVSEWLSDPPGGSAFLLATMPSKRVTAKAIAALARAFNWTTAVLLDDGDYVYEGFSRQNFSSELGYICVAKHYLMSSGIYRMQRYYEYGVNGAIVVGREFLLKSFFSNLMRATEPITFNFICGDGLQPTRYWLGNEKAVEGTVMLRPISNPIAGFKEYFLSLRPDTNKRNPWFAEFWEDYFDCWLPDGAQTPYNQRHAQMCRPDLRMSESDAKFVLEPQLQFVSDAVMAFAVAVKELRARVCHPSMPRADCLQRLTANGSELLAELKLVNFTSLSGGSVRFSSSGDALSRFRIVNFQPDPTSASDNASSTYSWREIGRYDASQQSLQLDWSRLRLRGGVKDMPVSSCTRPCSSERHKVRRFGDHCNCWNCIQCPDDSVLAEESHPLFQACIRCTLPTRPSQDYSKCELKDRPTLRQGRTRAGRTLRHAEGRPSRLNTITEPVSASLSAPEGTAAATIASAGIAASLLTSFQLVQFRNSPLVKASSLSLSLLLLLGLVACFSATFLLYARPTVLLCVAQRLTIGLGMAISAAALLVKAARTRSSAGRTISTKHQMIGFGLLVGVQLAVLVGWLWFKPAQVSSSSLYGIRQLFCSSLVKWNYSIGLAYPTLLLLVFTMVSIFIRNNPHPFNVPWHLSIAGRCSFVIWLVSVLILFNIDQLDARIPGWCFIVTLFAWTILASLFGPKLRILLCRPEENVHQPDGQPEAQQLQAMLQESGRDEAQRPML